ncbi:MAG TPA: CRTAC1 family protein [Blastocatellia bacterium]|nr:CRTAC1 family protein [Blastocatellia bacterium]
MESITGSTRQYAKRVVAILLVSTTYWLALIPDLSEAQRNQLASRFKFTRFTLPVVQGKAQKTVRQVHPSMENISAWISSVGASVALNDLDGDGLPNDICYIDPRTDDIIVSPAPGTHARFEPFALDHTTMVYNPDTMAPMGAIPSDYNEDGITDILVYYAGRTPVAFLRRGEKVPGALSPLTRDSYVPCEIYPRSELWNSSAATVADLDGDGHFDLIVGNYFQDGAAILDATATGTERMQESMSRAFNGGLNRVLRWEGATAGADPTVRFREVENALEGEVARGWTLAIAAGDLDGDLLPELYFANDFGPDRLLHNRSTPGNIVFARLEGEKTFSVPSSKVLGRDSFKGMGADFGDLNGDGLLDIYVSNITDDYSLHESHFVFLCTGETEQMKEGKAPFVDRSEALGLSRSGWAWECKVDDFDNDSLAEVVQATGFVKGSVNRWPEFQELAMANDNLLRYPGIWPLFQPGDDLSGAGHTPFFARGPDGRYYNIADKVGLGESQVSRGLAIGDVDADGRLDLVVANQWGPSYFYRNDSPGPGKFLGLNLLLPLRPDNLTKFEVFSGPPSSMGAGRPAIGATAVLMLRDGRKLVAQVDGGNGHSGKRAPGIHFGVGQIPDDALLTVDLRWRDEQGRIQSETLNLRPGLHTVMLGRQKAREDS